MDFTRRMLRESVTTNKALYLVGAEVSDRITGDQFSVQAAVRADSKDEAVEVLRSNLDVIEILNVVKTEIKESDEVDEELDEELDEEELGSGRQTTWRVKFTGRGSQDLFRPYDARSVRSARVAASSKEEALEAMKAEFEPLRIIEIEDTGREVISGQNRRPRVLQAD